MKTKPALHRSNVDIGIQNQDLNSQDQVLVFTGLKKASIFLIQNPCQEKALSRFRTSIHQHHTFNQRTPHKGRANHVVFA